MAKPIVIAHMLCSVDGSTVGKFFGDPRTNVANHYWPLRGKFDTDAIIWGRITAEGEYTSGHTLQLEPYDGPDVPRQTHRADPDATSHLITIDASGRLAWNEDNFADGGQRRVDRHVISVLTEDVSDAYLSHLQRLGISYTFAGKDRLDLGLALERLAEDFGFATLLLEGGGTLNGSFIEAELIDELSVLILPVIDGVARTKTTFDRDPDSIRVPFVSLELQESEVFDEGSVWLHYRFTRT